MAALLHVRAIDSCFIALTPRTAPREGKDETRRLRGREAGHGPEAPLVHAIHHVVVPGEARLDVCLIHVADVVDVHDDPRRIEVVPEHSLHVRLPRGLACMRECH